MAVWLSDFSRVPAQCDLLRNQKFVSQSEAQAQLSTGAVAPSLSPPQCNQCPPARQKPGTHPNPPRLPTSTERGKSQRAFPRPPRRRHSLFFSAPSFRCFLTTSSLTSFLPNFQLEPLHDPTHQRASSSAFDCNTGLATHTFRAHLVLGTIRTRTRSRARSQSLSCAVRRPRSQLTRWRRVFFFAGRQSVASQIWAPVQTSRVNLRQSQQSASLVRNAALHCVRCQRVYHPRHIRTYVPVINASDICPRL